MRIHCSDWESELSNKFKVLMGEISVFLPEFVSEICIYRKPEDNGGASVNFQRKYRRMDVYISGSLAHQDIENVVPFVLHEAAHAYNADICMCLEEFTQHFVPEENKPQLMIDIFMQHIEAQTQDLTESFIRLYKERKENQ